eukprot:XP_001692466.1 predicted protein [Chlamydomonas reinhardtii]
MELEDAVCATEADTHLASVLGGDSQDLLQDLLNVFNEEPPFGGSFVQEQPDAPTSTRTENAGSGQPASSSEGQAASGGTARMPSPQLGTPPVVEAQLVHPNLLGPAKPEHPTAVALAAPAAPTAWPVPGPAAALSAMTFGSPTQPSDAGVPPFATNASLAAGMCFAPATSAMAASNAGPQQQHPALAMPTPPEPRHSRSYSCRHRRRDRAGTSGLGAATDAHAAVASAAAYAAAAAAAVARNSLEASAAAAAAAAAAGASLASPRSGGNERGLATTAAGAAGVSHSAVEKQRRDRLNSLIDELRCLLLLGSVTDVLGPSAGEGRGRTGGSPPPPLSISGPTPTRDAPSPAPSPPPGAAANQLAAGQSHVIVKRGPDCYYVQASRPHTATAVGCFFMPQHGDIDILCTRVLLCAQIECRDRRGLLSDIVGALKELPLQAGYTAAGFSAALGGLHLARGNRKGFLSRPRVLPEPV